MSASAIPGAGLPEVVCVHHRTITRLPQYFWQAHLRSSGPPAPSYQTANFEVVDVEEPSDPSQRSRPITIRRPVLQHIGLQLPCVLLFSISDQGHAISQLFNPCQSASAKFFPAAGILSSPSRRRWKSDILRHDSLVMMVNAAPACPVKIARGEGTFK